MKKITWFFDFISPFAYLQFESLARDLPKDTNIKYCPILFAGLLKHWGHKGPAEIPSKRIFTYRYVHWLARKQNIPLNTPAIHPFNPIVLLRLALALNCEEAAIRKIFYFVWRDGKSVDKEENITSLLKELKVSPSILSEKKIKEQLHENGNKAIESGVFGVPTIIFKQQIFWGYDSTQMLVDYMNAPSKFSNDKNIAELPMGNIKGHGKK